MTMEETSQYIKHRLRIAGNPAAINVNEDTILYIYKFSKGIPRLINIICDFALLTAFTEKITQVSKEIIREVVNDLESRDYLNTTNNAKVPMSESSDADSSNVKAVENIESRLNQLEERVIRLMENYSAVNRFGAEQKNSLLVEHFEEQLICRTLEKFAEENKINELFVRVSDLEKITVLFNTEKMEYHLGMKIKEHFRKDWHSVSKERVDGLVRKIYCAVNETMRDLIK
jgi:hypothetical protein